MNTPNKTKSEVGAQLRISERPMTATRRSVLAMAAGSTLLTALQGCAPSQTVITYAGASTLLDLMGAAGAAFETSHRDTRVEITAGGSTQGILKVASGAADIGGSAREPQGNETTLVRFHPIARDALAIVTHRDVPLRQVDLAYLSQLYTTPESPAEKPITRVGKIAAHGTYQAFQAALGLRGVDLVADVQAGSNGELLAFVEASRGIGYVSLADATRAVAAGQPLRILPVKGQMPSFQSIAQGSYPLVRTLYLVVPRSTAKIRQRLAPGAAQFIAFLESPAGQTIIRNAGFVPANHA